MKIDMLSEDYSYPYEVTFFITFDDNKYKETFKANPFSIRRFKEYLKYRSYGKAYNLIKKHEQISSEKIY